MKERSLCCWQVVQAIGAPESEPFNFSNPKKIDGDGAIALVEAAKELRVDQFVMVTSLGTAKVGFPAGTAHEALEINEIGTDQTQNEQSIKNREKKR